MDTVSATPTPMFLLLKMKRDNGLLYEKAIIQPELEAQLVYLLGGPTQIFTAVIGWLQSQLMGAQN